MGEFEENNLTGNRKELYRKLKQGIWQSDNEAVIETESLRYQTAEQVEKVENPE